MQRPTLSKIEMLPIALFPSGKRQTELSQAAQLMFAEDFTGRILQFDETAAIAFAQIASICCSRQATLATRNVSDFEGCGLAIINPWEYD